MNELTRAKAELEEKLNASTNWAKQKRQLQDWIEQQPVENGPDPRFISKDDWVRAILEIGDTVGIQGAKRIVIEVDGTNRNFRIVP